MRRASALSRVLVAGAVPARSGRGAADRGTLVPTAMLGMLEGRRGLHPARPPGYPRRQVGLLRDSDARWLLAEPSRAEEAAELAAEAGTGVHVVTLGADILDADTGPLLAPAARPATSRT